MITQIARLTVMAIALPEDEPAMTVPLSPNALPQAGEGDMGSLRELYFIECLCQTGKPGFPICR